jgi:hypothetical protein
MSKRITFSENHEGESFELTNLENKNRGFYKDMDKPAAIGSDDVGMISGNPPALERKCGLSLSQMK